MIVLDKKSYVLLSYLLTLDEPETIMSISKTLNQSRRKIYYHLDKINDALPEGVDQIVSYPRIGIVLDAAQKEACRLLLEGLDDYSYVMSVEERVQLSLTYIAVSKERVTIDKLMKLTDVSRNTILNDLNNIREYLSEDDYNIHLQVTKARGYYLDCHPLSKIQFLYRLLYHIYTEGNKGFIDIVRERIIDLTGFNRYFSEDVNKYLHYQLSNAQEKLGKKINPQDSQFMVQILPYLLLSYRSIDLTDDEKRTVEREFSMTWQRREYQLAQAIADGLLAEFDLPLDKIEVSLVAMLLLSFRKDRDMHLESQDYDEMRQTLDNFLLKVTQDYGLTFMHRNELLNQLLTHCKALLYRKTYGILSVNPLTKYIKKRYSDLFGVVQSCAYILEEAWMIRMTDDDIAYIAIHLGGELEKDQETSLAKKTVVIVSNGGVGVQKLLLQQCRHYLVNTDIQAVFTSEQFYSVSDLMTIDAVISTSDALESCFPMIVVHPILDEEDSIKLIRFSRTHGESGQSHFSQELEKCLKTYVPDSKERYVLKAQIEKLVSQELAADDSKN